VSDSRNDPVNKGTTKNSIAKFGNSLTTPEECKVAIDRNMFFLTEFSGGASIVFMHIVSSIKI
jgi:hypothetical protein